MTREFDYKEAMMGLQKWELWADKQPMAPWPLLPRIEHGAAVIDSLQRDLNTTRHVKTDEMERDPVSGNPRPRFRFERVRVEDYDLHMGLRVKLSACFLAVVAALQRVHSPVYPEARQVFSDWQRRSATAGWGAAQEASEAAAIVQAVNRYLYELVTEDQIIQHNKEVANG